MYALVITCISRAAWTIAHAIRWVKESFWPDDLSAFRRASRVETGRVRKLVAVGIVRLSFMNRASVAAGPRIGFAPAAGGALGAGAAGAAAGAPLPSTIANTSSLVTLPPRPLPWTLERSSPCASAMRAATGVAFPLPGVAAGVLAGSGAAGFASADAVAPGWIRATIVPDWTVSSGSARISATTPETGAGISASTLSVEISTSVSPSAISSPTFLCHSRTVPSWTDSPIWGRTTSTSSPVAGGGAAAAPAPFSASFFAAT